MCLCVGRAAIEQLCLERDHLQESTEKLRGRCDEMEEQCVQHGRMHQRMKQRYTQLLPAVLLALVSDQQALNPNAQLQLV